MSDEHITFLLTVGFFLLIGVAVLFLELIAESQLATEHTAFAEDSMLDPQISAYKVAVVITAAASITSILG